MHPMAILGIVVSIVSAVVAIWWFTKESDEDRFSAMRQERNAAFGSGNPGTGRGNSDATILTGDDMGGGLPGSTLGEWTPLGSAMTPLCTSHDPPLCSPPQVISGRTARGISAPECCRDLSCAVDFSPFSETANEDWVGCSSQPTPTGVGQMVYKSGLSLSERQAGKTVAECCEYEPPVCTGQLNQGAENSGCGMEFWSGSGANRAYDATLTEQKCGAAYTKHSNSGTGYYQCEWDSSGTGNKCKKKVTTGSPAGVECTPPETQECISGSSFNIGWGTKQNNCTCPGTTSHNTSGTDWRCINQ